MMKTENWVLKVIKEKCTQLANAKVLLSFFLFVLFLDKKNQKSRTAKHLMKPKANKKISFSQHLLTVEHGQRITPFGREAKGFFRRLPKMFFPFFCLRKIEESMHLMQSDRPHEKFHPGCCQTLVRPGSFELVSKNTRQCLGLIKDGRGFSWSLDLFTRFAA